MSTYLAISSLLNFLASILLVTFISSSVTKSRVRQRYLYFLLSVTGWSGSYFLWQISRTEFTAYFFCQSLTVFSILIPIALYHFCISLAEMTTPIALRVGYGTCLALISAVPFGWVVEGVSSKAGHVYWPDAGFLMPLYLVYFGGFVITSGFVLIYGWRNHVGRRASDNLFVLLTCLVGFFGGATNFPLWYDIPLQPYGNILVSVYIFLLGYGLYSNRLQGVGVDFYKAFVGLLLNASVALFYLLGIALFRIMIDAEPLHGYELWVHGIVAFIVAMVVFWGVPLAKRRTENVVESIFRKERASALASLAELPTKLSNLSDIEAIAPVTADSIEEILDVEGASVFWLQAFESSFKSVYSTNGFPAAVGRYEIAVDSPLITTVSATPECIYLDNVYEGQSDEFYEALVRLKNDFGVEVVVPVFAGNEVYGLVLLRSRSQNQRWSEEEITSLFNVGAQVGLNVRVRDFERRSSEVDKLVALGTMAAGLSHEIRNPLVSVQTLGSLLSNRKTLDQMPEDFRTVLIRDINRIGSIVDGVAAFSKNQEARKTLTRISDVVESSLQIFQSDNELGELSLRVESGMAENVEVLGNLDQLVQVLVNLLDNAWHATEALSDPRILIESRLYSKGKSQWIELSVSDNGGGIPDSIADRIFDPFITSKDTGSREKKQGMGLGLAISKRIVDIHGGAISVSESDWGGAKFTVSLRIFEAPKD